MTHIIDLEMNEPLKRNFVYLYKLDPKAMQSHNHAYSNILFSASCWSVVDHLESIFT